MAKSFKILFPSKREFKIITAKTAKKTLQYFIANYTKERHEEKNKFVRWKDRVNEDKRKKKKLFDTGRMKKSFKITSDENEFIIKNETEYFQYHQLGDGQEERKMLYNSKRVEDLIKKSFEEEILKALKKKNGIK